MMRKFAALLLFAGSASLVWYVFGFREPPAATQGVAEKAGPYAPRDWQQLRESSLNISLYTFRDRNRSGIYDQGDLPMASVAVELTAPDGAQHSTISNSNGYANFKMARGSTSLPVNQPGAYQLRVLKPTGWQITSGNPEQEITFEILPGSVAGLVAKKPPHWVGLAPDLTLNQLTNDAVQSAPQDQALQIVSPQGEHHALDPDDQGLTRTTVYPGQWQVLFGNKQRSLTIVDAPVALIVQSSLSAGLTPLPHSVTENFDWLQRSTIDKIPNNHLSLHWDYLLAVHNQEYRGPGYVNGLTSGHAVAYNSSGHPVTISAPEGEFFDFVGGYFSVAWPTAEGEVLNIAAWRESQLVSSSRLTLSYLGPTWLEADLRSIDRLTLTTSHYWQFVVDDLTFRLAKPPLD